MVPVVLDFLACPLHCHLLLLRLPMKLCHMSITAIVLLKRA